ncbi:MAG: hypothetical protein M9921_00990 [Fimbriimonadaceae bacterium]|nr:hypothetical protein [Fimbriimonadaceae bacterium]
MGGRQRWWSGTLFVCLGAFIATLSWHRFDVADFFWQLRTGQLVAESGIPARDTLTFGSPGAPWFELRWLYCWGLFAVCRAGGYAAVTALQTLAILATFGISGWTARAWRSPLLGTAILGLAAVSCSDRFVPRPEIATYLFVAVYLAVIVRWREAGGKWLWALPALQVLWTNVHPLSALGPAMVLQLAIVEGVRAVRLLERGRIVTVGWVLALTLAACLMNPYGIAGALFPLRLFVQTQGSYAQGVIEELKSPFAHSDATSVVAFFMLGAAVVGIGVLDRKRKDPFLGLLVLTHGFLALSSVRNLPLFALVAIPFVLLRRSEPVTGGSVRLSWPMAVSLLACLAAGAWLEVSDMLSLWRSDKRVFGAGLAPNAYPLSCARYLKELGGSGLRVFNTMSEGGVLEFHGLTPYFDPRLEVHSEQVLRSGFASESDPVAFRALISRTGCQAALVSLDSAFAEKVAPAVGWELVMFDAAGAVFAAPDLAGRWPRLDIDRQLQVLQSTMRRWPEASREVTYEEVEQFLRAIGEDRRAENWSAGAF